MKQRGANYYRNKGYAIRIALLLFFSAVLSFVNFIWIRHNLSHIPPSWDQSFYIYLSLNEVDLLQNGDILGFLKFIFEGSPWAGPLVPITTAPFHLIFGPEIQTAYLVNSLYLFILLTSVFFIAERLSGTKAAVLAVFLSATFPSFIAYPRDYLYEFPLASLTALSYLFFLKSESFQIRRYVILSGIFIGLSLLAKTMGIIFFVLPGIYAISEALRGKDAERRKNSTYFLIVAGVIAAVYYVPNFGKVFGYLFHFGFGKGAQNFTMGVSSLSSFENWAIYLKAIVWRGISVGYFCLFLISLILFILRKKAYSRDYLMLWVWFISGYILLSLSPNKGAERYALPILVPISVIMAVHLTTLSVRPLKYFIIALTIIVGLTNYAYQTISVRSMYKPFFIEQLQVLEPVHHSYYFQRDSRADYRISWDPITLFSAMDRLGWGSPQDITVLVGADHFFLNWGIMELYGKVANMKGLVRHKFAVKTVSYGLFSEDEIGKSSNESHFVITKAGYQGPFYNKNNVTVKKLLEDRVPLATFTMNDGSSVYIYPGGRWPATP